MSKDLIINALTKLQKKEVANKEVWKARAYANAIKQIKLIEHPINSINDVDNIKGIGKKIKDKIQEILETGKLHQVEEMNANVNSINELTRVHGIGPSKAKELVENHNIKSIKDLKENVHLLNDKQKMGLKYLEDFELRIPRKEMLKHEAFFLDNIPDNLTCQIVGSFRRYAKDSGDIDVLISSDDDSILGDEDLLKKIVKSFEKKKYCVNTFALGNKKYLGVCKIKYGRHFRRLDILITSKYEFPFAQLYFTGNPTFNVEMRNIALSQGYSLSEYGLKYANGKKKGEFVETKFTTEKSIFDFLKLEYVAPRYRLSGALKVKT